MGSRWLFRRQYQSVRFVPPKHLAGYLLPRYPLNLKQSSSNTYLHYLYNSSPRSLAGKASSSSSPSIKCSINNPCCDVSGVTPLSGKDEHQGRNTQVLSRAPLLVTPASTSFIQSAAKNNKNRRRSRRQNQTRLSVAVNFWRFGHYPNYFGFETRDDRETIKEPPWVSNYFVKIWSRHQKLSWADQSVGKLLRQ